MTYSLLQQHVLVAPLDSGSFCLNMFPFTPVEPSAKRLGVSKICRTHNIHQIASVSCSGALPLGSSKHVHKLKSKALSICRKSHGYNNEFVLKYGRQGNRTSFNEDCIYTYIYMIARIWVWESVGSQSKSLV